MSRLDEVVVEESDGRQAQLNGRIGQARRGLGPVVVAHARAGAGAQVVHVAGEVLPGGRLGRNVLVDREAKVILQ
jgi:hypothetical protein